MKKISKIILYHEEKFLLMLRDDKPDIAYPNIWTLFGGNIEENESPEDCLKRELLEEINFELTNMKKFMENTRDQDGQEVEEHIFIAEVPEKIVNNKLNEGQKMKFFTIKEIDKNDVFEPFSKYIKEFSNSLKNQ